MPQLIPDALLDIIPPTIALFTEAGSGANLYPYFDNISLTLPPTMPGCNRIYFPSSITSYFSHFLPTTANMELLMA